MYCPDISRVYGLKARENGRRLLSCNMLWLSHKNDISTGLRLGVIATVGPYILPDLVPLLNARDPKCCLNSKKISHRTWLGC